MGRGRFDVDSLVACLARRLASTEALCRGQFRVGSAQVTADRRRLPLTRGNLPMARKPAYPANAYRTPPAGKYSRDIYILRTQHGAQRNQR